MIKPSNISTQIKFVLEKNGPAHKFYFISRMWWIFHFKLASKQPCKFIFDYNKFYQVHGYNMFNFKGIESMDTFQSDSEGIV